MISFKQFHESKRTIDPPKGSAEDKHKVKLTKGLKKVSENEFWKPENIKKANMSNQYGESFSYDQNGDPLYKGNADWSRGKWRTVYKASSAGSYSGPPVSLEVVQQDEKGKVIAKEWWISKY